MYPRGKALKWHPKAVGFPNLHSDEKHNSQPQKTIHCASHHSSFKYQWEWGGGVCQLPSTRISVGPQAQMEEAGKFASASTESAERGNKQTVTELLLFFYSFKKCGCGATGE